MTGPQPRSTTLCVAAAQARSVPADVEANVATAVTLVDTAADRGARVVVLPELFLTGYAPETWSLDATLTLDDPRLDPLRKVAAARDVVVVSGAAVRRPQGAGGDVPVTLSLLVADPTGEVSAPYDKQHLFDDERSFFTAGDHGASLVVDGWEIGLAVCYDGCFPEHAAAAARDGASVYVCSAAYMVGSEHRRDLYYRARALDNGIYVVFSGLVGPCGESVFNGGSAVFDPEGRVLTRADEEDPAVVVTRLEAAEVERAQAAHPMGRQRLGTLGPRTRHTVGAR